MYPVIRIFLSNSSFSFPHVVDVKWRLDNHLKEDNLEKINEPVYLIDLKIEVNIEAVERTKKCVIEKIF